MVGTPHDIGFSELYTVTLYLLSITVTFTAGHNDLRPDVLVGSGRVSKHRKQIQQNETTQIAQTRCMSDYAVASEEA